MNNKLIRISVSLLFFAGAVIGSQAFSSQIALAQNSSAVCPEGYTCEWIDTTNVRDYGVIPENRDGIGFDYDADTQDKLCQIKGFDHSWAGYNVTRKWNKCNDENQVWWNGSSWSQRRCNSRTYLAYSYCTTRVPNAAPTIEWSEAPTSAQCDATYVVEARGTDSDGNLTAVSVDKNGEPFAYNGGGDGKSETSGNPTSDSGPKSVTFTAWANDSRDGTSETISHTVTIGSCKAPNQEPKGDFSASCSALSGSAFDPDAPGQSIGIHFYVGGPAGSGSWLGHTSTDGSSKGYSLTLPESMKTNTDKTIYAYAIDTQGGNNPEIGRATVRCAPAQAPSGFISASPSSISNGGGDATISWSVSDATSCSASGSWSGAKAASGSEKIRVTQPATFTLSCTGQGGTWSQSADVGVKGRLTIGHLFVSPSTVSTGDKFVISGSATWNGSDYIKQHRAYFANSYGEKRWTPAGGQYASTVTVNTLVTAETNRYSMYAGSGNSYSVVYEVEDWAGNTASETVTLNYLSDPVNACTDETTTHTCSASYSGYAYPKQQSSDTLTVYQSCNISDAEYQALKVPSGTATRIDRDYAVDCPQCWDDTHSYAGTTWHCSRSLGGYEYSYMRSTFPITYYTSCSISLAEKQALERQGYVYSHKERTQSISPGEWTDVHYMTRCVPDTPTENPNNNNGKSCNDPAALNYQASADCVYNPGNNGGENGDGNGGNGGNSGNGGPRVPENIPGFTVTADSQTAQIQFLGQLGAVSASRRIEANPVNGFSQPVTLRVTDIRSKSGAGLPEGVEVLYSFDGKEFSGVSSAVQSFNASIGGGRYIGEQGSVGSTFRISFSNAVKEAYDVTIEGSGGGLSATYVLTIDPKNTNPTFQEI